MSCNSCLTSKCFLLAAEHDYLLDSPAFLKELSKFLKPERSKRKIQKKLWNLSIPLQHSKFPPPFVVL